MKPSKDALDEYKAMAKNSPGSMESKIKAHLVANCPKYDESRFDSCMQHLVDCAKEILGSRNGRPMATAELDNSGKIVQFYADEHDRENMKPTPEAESAVNEWIKKFKPKFRTRKIREAA